MKKDDFNLRAIFVLIALIALVVSTIGGYFYYDSIIKFSKARSHKQVENFLYNLERSINSHLEWYQLSTDSLAGLKDIRSAIIKQDRQSLKTATVTLAHFQKSLKVNNVFLLNSEGIVVADSRPYPQNNFVGNNYSFRPYFKKAIKGKPSIYIALGTTSKERGIYYSHPVYDAENSMIKGVAVIKVSMDFIEEKLKEVSQGIALLTDPNYVIFLSSRNELSYSSLWKIPEDKIDELTRSAQFGTERIIWAGISRIDDYNAIDKRGNQYFIHTKELKAYTGWKIIYLHDKLIMDEVVTVPIKQSIGVGILISCLFLGVIIIFLFINANGSIIKRKAAENELRLEKEKLEEALSKVKELSGLLPICSSCSKIRDDKGYWNRIEIYIENHSKAEFSHGICPECSEKLYGNEDWYKRMKMKKEQNS